MKTTKLGKWAMVGLIAAAMAGPLPALAAQGAAGPKAKAQVTQANPNCPNGGQRLRDGSGRARKDSMQQNRGAGLRDGSGRGYGRGAGARNGACDCGAAKS